METQMKTVFKCSLSLLLLLWFCSVGVTQADEAGLLEKELRMDRAAGLDNQSLDRVLAAARRNRLRDEETVRLLNQVRNAAREALPTAPLINKIEEGVSKRIDSGRIEAALGRMTENLRFADALTAGEIQESSERPPTEHQRVLIRLSELLSAGMTQSEMRRLYQSWQPAKPGQKVEAMTFYAVTKQAGLEPKEADQIASAGIEQNHFHGFPLDLAMMIKAAKANNIQSSEIVAHALRVIRGEETVTQAHRQMGIGQMHPSPSQGSGNPRGRNEMWGLRRGGSLSGGSGSGGGSSHGSGGGGHSPGGRRGR
jgi:uncharacterized membrane protein YgcG